MVTIMTVTVAADRLLGQRGDEEPDRAERRDPGRQ